MHHKLTLFVVTLLATTALAARADHGPFGPGGPHGPGPGPGGPGWHGPHGPGPGGPGWGGPHGPGPGGPGWHGPNPGWGPPHHHQPDPVVVSCSPELMQNNLDAAEAALNATAAKPELQRAATFQRTIREIQGDADKTTRVNRYLAVVGVDNADKMADLLGGEHTDQYVETARQKLELTPAQAQLLVDALSKALRGSLD